MFINGKWQHPNEEARKQRIKQEKEKSILEWQRLATATIESTKELDYIRACMTSWKEEKSNGLKMSFHDYLIKCKLEDGK